MTKILRLGIYCVFFLLFLIILRNEIKVFLSRIFCGLSRFCPEIRKGLSLVKLAGYVLNPLHLWLEIPDVKMYTLVTLFLFGPLAKSFIYLALLFHVFVLFCCIFGKKSRTKF